MLSNQMSDLQSRGWSQNEAEQLVKLALEHNKHDWKAFGQILDKTPEDCQSLFEFFAQLDYYFEDFEPDSSGSRKRRHRRKASMIERKFKCQYPECYRAYGTQAALKYHVKTKHGNESPPPVTSEMAPSYFMMRQNMPFQPEMMPMPHSFAYNPNVFNQEHAMGMGNIVHFSPLKMGDPFNLAMSQHEDDNDHSDSD
jgi:hypothetical protein